MPPRKEKGLKLKYEKNAHMICIFWPEKSHAYIIGEAKKDLIAISDE